MCCLETKHNSSPSGWRLEKRERQRKREKEKEGDMLKKHNRALQSTKQVVFILHLKTYEFFSPPPSRCVALTERGKQPS